MFRLPTWLMHASFSIVTLKCAIVVSSTAICRLSKRFLARCVTFANVHHTNLFNWARIECSSACNSIFPYFHFSSDLTNSHQYCACGGTKLRVLYENLGLAMQDIWKVPLELLKWYYSLPKIPFCFILHQVLSNYAIIACTYVIFIS